MRRIEWTTGILAFLVFATLQGCSSEMPPAALTVTPLEVSERTPAITPVIVQSVDASSTVLSPADISFDQTSPATVEVPPLPTFVPEPILEHADLPGETVYR